MILLETKANRLQSLWALESALSLNFGFLTGKLCYFGQVTHVLEPQFPYL